MKYINCMDKVVQTTLTNTINFWSENSYQHIDAIINGYSGSGAVLYPNFENELKNLSKEFMSIQQYSNSNLTRNDIMTLSKKFMITNNNFIKILERLKFEGFNGYPVLFETVYHFIYEQEYANKLIEPMHKLNNQMPTSSIFKTVFQQGLLKTNKLKCIYTQMYFWSIIGGQHPSILITISRASTVLPNSVKDEFKDVANKFNNINYELSNTYNNLSKKSLYSIFQDFYILNNNFLDILNDIKRNDQELPDIFYDVLNHVIDEHKYVDTLIDDFKMVFTS